MSVARLLLYGRLRVRNRPGSAGRAGGSLRCSSGRLCPGVGDASSDREQHDHRAQDWYDRDGGGGRRCRLQRRGWPFQRRARRRYALPDEGHRQRSDCSQARGGATSRRPAICRWDRGRVPGLVRPVVGPVQGHLPSGARQPRVRHLGRRRLPLVLRYRRRPGRKDLVQLQPRRLAHRRSRRETATRSEAATRAHPRGRGWLPTSRAAMRHARWPCGTSPRSRHPRSEATQGRCPSGKQS